METLEGLLRQAMHWHQNGRLDEAAVLYQRILQANPRQFDTLHLFGILNAQVGDYQAAAKLMGEALSVHAGNPALFNNYGNALLSLERLGEALEAYDRAVALKPDYAEAHNNRGAVLQRLGRAEEALEAFDRAIALRPDYAMAYAGRALVNRDLKRLTESLADYAKALDLNPNDTEAAAFRFGAAGLLCDWTDRNAQTIDLLRRIDAGEPISPFIALMLADRPGLHYKAATSYARKYPAQTPIPLPARDRTRMRLGYLSADYHDHPVAHLVAPLLEKHDRGAFEVYALSLSPSDKSPIRARIEKSVDRFIDLHGRSDPEAAHAIAHAGIDILIDLNGHTAGGRPGILSHRPAPIAVNYLGYAGTSGLSYIDYILADDVVIPEATQTYFSEKIARLPDSFMMADVRRAMAPTPSRKEAGLPEDAIVFCCFNNGYKLTPDMLDLWARIANEIPQSVLWFNIGNDAAREKLRKEAQWRGLAPARLIFAPFMEDMAAHLARLSLADLFLDTLPYNAHSTAIDALNVGLPILTCAGQAMPARVAASLARAAGTPELAAATLADYEALALKLARDPAALRSLKARLMQNRDTAALFDSARFLRHIEAAYRTMWDRKTAGRAAETFAVTP